MSDVTTLNHPMKKEEIFKAYDDLICSTYTRQPIIFVKGKGMTLTDIDGKKYLDFFPGWGVNNLGHCHPKVMSAVRDQVETLIHVPNNFFHPHQAKLAKEIVRLSFPSKVFFCNSGAEANEAAIKFSRAYGEGKRFEIITFKNSFHGRTMGALSATGQTKYQEGFAPLPAGFKIIDFNDIAQLESAISANTVAILLELVQGEGGIHVVKPEYIKRIREICDEKKILLIFDEVQTGLGRTGKMFGFENYGVTPDIMTLAKALGGGLPIGAMVVKKEISGVFKPGMHATTFGGSPLVCKASLAVFKAIIKYKMLKNSTLMGEYLRGKLTVLKEKYSCITSIRGLGLMVGIQLNIEGKDIFSECLSRGLIINCTQGNVLRIMPALNVTKKQIDKAIFILEQSLKKVAPTP